MKKFFKIFSIAFAAVVSASAASSFSINNHIVESKAESVCYQTVGEAACTTASQVTLASDGSKYLKIPAIRLTIADTNSSQIGIYYDFSYKFYDLTNNKYISDAIFVAGAFQKDQYCYIALLNYSNVLTNGNKYMLEVDENVNLFQSVVITNFFCLNFKYNSAASIKFTLIQSDNHFNNRLDVVKTEVNVSNANVNITTSSKDFEFDLTNNAYPTNQNIVSCSSYHPFYYNYLTHVQYLEDGSEDYKPLYTLFDFGGSINIKSASPNISFPTLFSSSGNLNITHLRVLEGCQFPYYENSDLHTSKVYSLSKTIIYTNTDENYPNEWVEVELSNDPLFENGGTPNVYSNVKGDSLITDEEYYTQTISISPYDEGGWDSNEGNLASSLDSYATLNGDTNLSSLEGCEVYAPSANKIAIKIKKADVENAMTNDGYCEIFIRSGAAIYDGYYLNNIKINFNNSAKTFEVNGYKQEITLTLDKEYDCDVTENYSQGEVKSRYFYLKVDCSDKTIPLDEYTKVIGTLSFAENPDIKLSDEISFTNDGLMEVEVPSTVSRSVVVFSLIKGTYLTYDNTHEQALINVTETCYGYFDYEHLYTCSESDYNAIQSFRNEDGLRLNSYNTNDGLCAGESGYYQDAKESFNGLTSWQKNIVINSSLNDDAIARLQTWATMNNETFDIANQQFVKNNSYKNRIFLKQNSEGESAVVAIALSISVISLFGYFVISKKKKMH